MLPVPTHTVSDRAPVARDGWPRLLTRLSQGADPSRTSFGATLAQELRGQGPVDLAPLPQRLAIERVDDRPRGGQ